jgi:hypothetical protein
VIAQVTVVRGASAETGAGGWLFAIAGLIVSIAGIMWYMLSISSYDTGTSHYDRSSMQTGTPTGAGADM